MAVDVSTEIVVHRPRAAVADYAFDPGRLAEWRSDVVAVRRERAGSVGVGSRFLVRSKGRLRDVERIDEIVALVPLASMTLRTVLGDTPTEFELTLAPDLRSSTLVTMRSTAEVTGSLAMVTGALLGRTLRRSAATDLARLKRILELAREG